MKSIYNTAIRERNAVTAQLGQFATETSGPTSVVLQSQIASSLNVFSNKIDQYESLAKQEPSRARQQELLVKSKKLRQSLTEQQSSFDNLCQNHDQTTKPISGPDHGQSHSQDVNGTTHPFDPTSAGHPDLLGRRPFVSYSNRNSGSASHTPVQSHVPGTGTEKQPSSSTYANTGYYSSYAGPAAPSLLSTTASSTVNQNQLHVLGQEAESDPLKAFTIAKNLQLDMMLKTGRDALFDVSRQNNQLKNAQRGLYNAANSLGISGKTIKMVHRRAKEDKAIFAGCVVAFFVFAWMVLRFFRG